MRLLAAFLCAITVIEPADAPARNILQYGTYLGGSHKDSVRAIAVDADGNAYAGGETLSPDFPSTPGAFLTNSGVSADDYAGFVAKIAPDGKRLLYSTFLRGSPGKGLIRTFVNALAVDSQGNAYAAGSTCSPDFPVTPGAFQQHAPGPGPNLLEPCDAFVAKLDATGSHLLYATYLGGAGSDSATSIWVDTQANAYVAGYTSSPDFPVTEDALQRSHGGGKDGFLVKLDAQGRRLLYGTFLGGTEMDEVAAMAGDSRGNVYVAGATRSSEFPPLTRRRRASPDFDAFFLRITPGARPPAAASLRIGGSGDDAATAIALGPDSDVYVAGWTASGDFPCTTNALERRFRGGKTDAFWVRVAGAAGQRPRVAYSSLLGGSDDDAAAAIAIDG